MLVDNWSITIGDFNVLVNIYIVRSYRDVIVVANIVIRRTSKAQSIVMY